MHLQLTHLPLHRAVLALSVLVAAVGFVACETPIEGLDERLYSCQSDEDCFDGFRCVGARNGKKYCWNFDNGPACDVFGGPTCEFDPDATDVPDSSDTGRNDQCVGLNCDDVACPAGSEDCGAGCVNLATSRLNCGACGAACRPGETCADGMCRCGENPGCTGDVSTVCCQGSCTTSDDALCNCGGEGLCGNTETCCDDACVDTTSDAANCGACGATCPSGASCSNGECICGASFCPVTADHVTDIVCGPPCMLTCEAPWEDCDGGALNGCETNLDADERHCGSCGRQCGDTSRACVDGACDPVIEMSIENGHTCVLRTSGLVACWGKNGVGQLGADSTQGSLDEPTPFLDPDGNEFGDAIAVSTTPGRTCVATETSVYCAGRDLLDPSEFVVSGTLLATVESDRSIVDMTLGGTQTSTGFVCVVLDDGRAQCLGGNDSLELGNASPGASSPTFVDVVLPGTPSGGFESVSAGSTSACGIFVNDDASRDVYCWGANQGGKTGLGDRSGESLPGLVVGAEGSVRVEVAPDHACSLDADNVLVCWGENDHRQVSPASPSADCPETGDCVTPHVTSLDCSPEGFGTGQFFTCGRCVDGSVWCWGLNGSGQLGRGTIDNDGHPPDTQVAGVNTAVRLTAGGDRACVVLEDGTMRCWGGSEGAPGEVPEIP